MCVGAITNLLIKQISIFFSNLLKILKKINNLQICQTVLDKLKDENKLLILFWQRNKIMEIEIGEKEREVKYHEVVKLLVIAGEESLSGV